MRKVTLGPAVLVTAAFIGPGTLLTASIAGARYGYLLLWAVAFAMLATIVLQEMAARLGIVTQNGLAQAIARAIPNPLFRLPVIWLVFVSILIGNAAYQTGNLLGAGVGADLIVQQTLPGQPSGAWLGIAVLVVSAVALVVIWMGELKLLQRLMFFLIASMSFLFVASAILSRPDPVELATGLIPSLPVGSEWFVIGLIGTTVVPYNLFLHASAAAEKWKTDPEAGFTIDAAVSQSRFDTVVAVVVGGLVTAAILITSSSAFHSQEDEPHSLTSVADVANQLKPALGEWATWLFATGLFAAGLSSAITAPVAAGYAAAGCLGWENRLSNWRLKSVATLVLICGASCAILFGSSPAETIILAQVANGMLLPLIAAILIWLANQSSLMKTHSNRWLINSLSAIVLAVVTLIGLSNIIKAIDKMYAGAI